jgi:hypothetical protein
MGMQIRRLFLVFALMGVLAWAAAIDGKWTAEIETPNGVRTNTYTFKADGAKLTGTVSGRMGDTAIQDGAIQGDEISFVVVREFNGQEFKIQYKGKVSGDELKMTMQAGDREPRDIVAKRVKE